MADGFERALQALQQQTWIAKRAAQLVKEGRDSLAAMTQANDEWNQKCQTGEVLATEMEYMRQYSRLKPYSLTHGEALFVLHLMEFKWRAARHGYPRSHLHGQLVESVIDRLAFVVWADRTRFRAPARRRCLDGRALRRGRRGCGSDEDAPGLGHAARAIASQHAPSAHST